MSAKLSAEKIMEALRKQAPAEMSAAAIAQATGASSARVVAPTLQRMASRGDILPRKINGRLHYRLPSEQPSFPLWTALASPYPLAPAVRPVKLLGG